MPRCCDSGAFLVLGSSFSISSRRFLASSSSFSSRFSSMNESVRGAWLVRSYFRGVARFDARVFGLVDAHSALFLILYDVLRGFLVQEVLAGAGDRVVFLFARRDDLVDEGPFRNLMKRPYGFVDFGFGLYLGLADDLVLVAGLLPLELLLLHLDRGDVFELVFRLLQPQVALLVLPRCGFGVFVRVAPGSPEATFPARRICRLASLSCRRASVSLSSSVSRCS